MLPHILSCLNYILLTLNNDCLISAGRVLISLELNLLELCILRLMESRDNLVPNYERRKRSIHPQL